MDSNYPLARNRNIVVQDLRDELLVYDLDAHKALCLNLTTVLVWRECDGFKSVSDISNAINKSSKFPVNEDIVRLALKQLKEQKLLENPVKFLNEFDAMSRREIVKRIGFASLVALPMISAIVAPTAAHAASTSCGCNGSPGGFSRSSGCPCINDHDCCSNVCNGKPGAEVCTGSVSGSSAACCFGTACIPNGEICNSAGHCCETPGVTTICDIECIACTSGGTGRDGSPCTSNQDCCSNFCFAGPLPSDGRCVG